ncbi:MAG: hypothetical protein K0V04_46735 [Deltaproteobacteria bacterium]|nr:hypothetical protein [Deltaproteobacteria bacterium]
MRTTPWLGIALTISLGCTGGRGETPEPTSIGLPPPTSSTTASPDSEITGDAPPDGSGPGPTDDTLDGGSTDGPPSCVFCDGPNQICIDDRCITTCQGQQPDPCGPDQVCDVISGECRAPDAACTLAGPTQACGPQQCGPGSVCDGQRTCVPVAPCGDVACLPDGNCWGSLCSCTRAIDCATPSVADLNGPFATEIGDLEFADDCTAWMVTLRSGTDFVRRLTPDGTVTEWGGVSNLNMGEVKVRKAVTPPAGLLVEPTARGLAHDERQPPLGGDDGLGEVAITYTCCSTCGCFTDPPQGVARLVPEDLVNPLPLVIEATVTQGSGPFGSAAADAGPFGLTWGIDRVLYVGNSTANGDVVTADLELGTQSALGSLPSRVTAGAPLSAVHLLMAVEGGSLYLFNVETLAADFLVDLTEDVTSLSHDAFDGSVYAGLRNLDVVVIDPWTGTVTPFDVMPGLGRVTVGPDGQLWFSPVAVLEPNPISAWDLPDAL